MKWKILYPMRTDSHRNVFNTQCYKSQFKIFKNNGKRWFHKVFFNIICNRLSQVRNVACAQMTTTVGRDLIIWENAALACAYFCWIWSLGNQKNLLKIFLTWSILRCWARLLKQRTQILLVLLPFYCKRTLKCVMSEFLLNLYSSRVT